MKRSSRLLAAGIVAAAAVMQGAAVAAATDQPDDPGTTTEPSAVEDFAYPQADKIFKEKGILLKRGDGHIVLATCDSRPDLVEMSTRDLGKFCFRVTGKKGYLSMELPRVYGIKGNDYKLRANMTVNNRDVSFDITKNAWTPVGETADPTHRDHTLLELVATR
ncbi:hypothetical protein Scani_02020 [Streptomyces caniferus]|uniref:Secreted protein n=1 Tax=Streptomyces caniferus TaxID=285557 RepID=A0A640RYQ6_9ACTN|nr:MULTISPECIES: hypothetical protein [Streptomyces]GFE03934.1 hypothetical protein Scani_02020 [Streptomyces caniferus]